MTEVTQKQKEKIELYEKQFEKNIAEYINWGSQQDCRFGIYVSPNPEDKNITIIMTTITGISDNYQTYKITNNIMIEPNGESCKLTDIYPSDYVFDYLEKLTKIN
jgi:hypothetical protein